MVSSSGATGRFVSGSLTLLRALGFFFFFLVGCRCFSLIL